ncbi:MAG: acyltransferase [Desulfuromonadales bacterium]|nr:acyltransferase [Desulfuromonadales bacterium]
MNFLPGPIRGVIASLLMGLNILAVSLPIFFFSLLKLIIPVPPWRRFCTVILNNLVSLWTFVNGFLWAPRPKHIEWRLAATDGLDLKSWYLVTSNHQSWSDIFIVQGVLNRRIPQLKFFLKQELIWIPIIGLCWWALDFPFMQRYSRSYLKKHPEKLGKDLETTRRACAKCNDQPTSLFNFMEGTRFTPEKHRQQRSPYTHLLKPKVAGTGLVCDVMGEKLKTMVDITINYHGQTPTFWDFACGRIKQTSIIIESVPIPEELLGRDYATDSNFRKKLIRWVNSRWAIKDALLDETGET